MPDSGQTGTLCQHTGRSAHSGPTLPGSEAFLGLAFLFQGSHDLHLCPGPGDSGEAEGSES